MSITFRTEIEPYDTSYTLEYGKKIMLLGSCFTQNIGEKLSNLKFNCMINPLGISYNPISISKMLDNIASNQPINSQKILQRETQYYHYDYHSSITSTESKSLEESIIKIQSSTKTYIEESSLCFVSLGTSIVHRLISSGKVVSNCHKMPQSLFEQGFLTYEETLESLELIASSLKKINEKIEVVFTISPIRHTRHGLISNQRSKATLIAAVHAMIENSTCCHYFPSYEIMQDDLRDYRFYKKDFIHPNETAINYIWDYLINAACTGKTRMMIKKVSQVKAKLQHKPLRHDLEIRESFLKKTLVEIEQIEKDIPTIQFEKEKLWIAKELESLVL